MKLKYIAGAFLFGAMALSSCSDFTEIDQKGMNLLSTTDQLDMLLNQEYYIGVSDLNRLVGSNIYYPGNIPTILANPAKTTTQILLSYDEEGHAREQVDLTSSDGLYANCYNYIGTVANPILQRVGSASGPETAKQALRAEALTIRAYFHWLAAIKFAKVYNPSTADTEKCIAYLMDDQDIKQPTEQLTQAEVYQHILDDLDAAIELDALPVVAVNRMRFCKAAPYAIKAMVLQYMQKYSEASQAASAALNINNTITDYNRLMVPITSAMGMPVSVVRFPQLALEQDYFTDADIEFFAWLTPRYYDSFEEKNIVRNWFETYHTMMWMGSWEATDPVIGGTLQSVFGVGEGSMSYGLDGDNRVGRINLSVQHMYLILAENAIADNKIDEAMGHLDKIRVGRFFPQDYVALKGRVTTKAEAIKMLKKVQHGENVFNIHNFINFKRWTLLPDYKEDISWTINGKTYTLKPESTLWVFPFPKNLMSQNPNFEHNYPTVDM